MEISTLTAESPDGILPRKRTTRKIVAIMKKKKVEADCNGEFTKVSYFCWVPPIYSPPYIEHVTTGSPSCSH